MSIYLDFEYLQCDMISTYGLDAYYGIIRINVLYGMDRSHEKRLEVT